MHKNISFCWDIHYVCNYRCPYCWFNGQWHFRNNCKSVLEPEELLKGWRNIYELYGPAYIEIVGGEPFLFPGFIELVKGLSIMHVLNITTNLSSDVEKFAEQIDSSRVKIGPTFHPSFADIGDFLEKAMLLKEKEFLKSVSYLAYPPQVKLIPYYKKKFNENKIEMTIQTFWGTHHGLSYPQSYSEDEKRLIRGDLARRGEAQFQLEPKMGLKGELCNAGRYYVVVKPDGAAYRCGNSSEDGKMGNLFNENFRLLDSPLPCTSEFCKCNEWAFLLEDDAINSVFDENKEKNIQETMERKIVLESRPLKLGVIVTDWCNLNCIMCIDGRHKGQFTLSESMLTQINELLPYLEEINWQGGEFFHLSYMKELFRNLKRYTHIHHEITTNGLLLDREWIALLSDMNIKMSFSIDSPHKDTYEYIRRGGSYETLIDNLNAIIDLEKKCNIKIPRIVVAVVMKANYQHLIDFVPFLKKYGFESICFNPVFFVKSEENIFIHPEKLDFSFLNQTRNNLEHELRMEGISFSWALPTDRSVYNEGYNILNTGVENHLFCSLPWKSIWICADRNGDIFPDCSCEHSIGNVSKDSLLDAWNNQKMQEYRRRVLAKDISLCKKECVNGLSMVMNTKTWASQ